MGIPKFCWADQVKFEFGGHFGGQKSQKRKSRKIDESVFAIFDKTVGHKGLKFGTGSVLNFVFIKIFVGGRRDNDTKMSTNITTRTTTRTSRSSPRPARLRRR